MEVRYSGRTYKSRLEARWGVFLEKLGVEHASSTETTNLPSGSKYRPSFWLPGLGLVVDVKPVLPFDYNALRRLWEFAVDLGHDTLLIVGPPTRHKFAVVNRVTCAPIDQFAADFEGASEMELANELVESLLEWGSVQFASTPFGRDWIIVNLPLPPNEDLALHEALLAAKTARFDSER